MIAILPAHPSHGAGAATVAQTVRFQPDSARSTDGYLVHIATPEEYARRFAASAYSVVAVNDGAVVGFLRAVGGEEAELAPHYAELTAPHSLDGYLLIDQIGLLPAYKGRGLAQQMLDAVIARSGARRLGAVIMHGPVRNARSLGFFTGRNGFSLVREFSEPPYDWGYYEKQLVVVS